MANITQFVKECKLLIGERLDWVNEYQDEKSAGYINGLQKAMELLGKPLSLSTCLRPECGKRYLPRKGKKYCSESCRQLAYRSRKLSTGDHVIREPDAP
jgi:hypothetical protein